MKSLMAAVLVASVLFSAGTSLASQDLGQPAPLGRVTEFCWALGYHYYMSEWQSDDEDAYTGKIKHNNYWIQVNYTFAENWAFYTRFGVADMRIEDLFLFDPPQDFEGKYGFNLTLGINGFLYRQPSWGIGPVVQATFYGDYETEVTGMLPEDQDGDTVDILARYEGMRDINLGLAAQVSAGPVVLYGGGFGYWTTADGWAEVTLPGESPERERAALEEKGSFGGYAGVRIPLGRAWSFHAEGQYKSETSFSVAFSQKLGAYFD